MPPQSSSTPSPAGPIRRPAPSVPHRQDLSALSLALPEEIDLARPRASRHLSRADLDAAMTRPEPRLPDSAAGEDLIDGLADRRYRQHVRSVELERP